MAVATGATALGLTGASQSPDPNRDVTRTVAAGEPLAVFTGRTL